MMSHQEYIYLIKNTCDNIVKYYYSLKYTTGQSLK